MATALTKVLESLGGTRDGVQPSIQAFPPLNTVQIAAELGIESRAEEEGKREIPSSESDCETVVEGDVRGEIERRARKAAEDYRSQVDLYEARIRRAIITTGDTAQIEAAGQNALSDFHVEAANDLDHLHTARFEVAGREEEFESFRSLHKLARLPDEIVPGRQLQRALILLLFIAGESALNGIFFAEGSEMGLIGGLLEAVVLSCLNIGPAAIVGTLGLPLLRHRRRSVRLSGVVLLGAYTAYALGLNLLIGVYRDLFVQAEGIVLTSSILDQLSNASFILREAKSWILSALGLLLNAVCIIDSVGLTDRYLGFGKVGHQRANAIRRYAEDKQSRLAGLTRRRNSAVSEMFEVINLVRSAEYDLSLALDGRSRLHANFRAYLDHLATEFKRLMQRYREANVRARTTQAPARFGEPAEFALPFEIPVLAVFDDLASEKRKASIERMEYFIQEVNRQFETAANKYHSVDALTGTRSSDDVDS